MIIQTVKNVGDVFLRHSVCTTKKCVRMFALPAWTYCNQCVSSFEYLKNYMSKLHQIFCARCLWPWLDPLLQPQNN